MYVILVYDVGEKRVGKMLKLCRRYLSWIQNSVFEGNLSKAQLRDLKMQIEDIIDKEKDSVIFFSSRMECSMDREILGKERMPVDNFL